MLTYDIPEADFNCGWGDLGCAANETVARLMGGMISSMGDFIGQMLTGAFQSTSVVDSSWALADGQFWFWVSVMAIVLTGVALFQMIPVIILRNWSRVFQIVAGLVLAIPAAGVAVWLMQQLSAFGDEVTNSLIHSLQDQSMAASLLRMFGYTPGGEGQLPIMTQEQWLVTMLTKRDPMQSVSHWVGQALTAGAVTVLMSVAALFLYVGMAIRGFGLVALAATAPVGIMMVGQPKAGVWAAQWVKMAIGLLIAKPLAAGILVLAVHICGTGTELSLLIVSIGAIFASAFAPLWAVKLVSFASAEVEAAMKRPSTRQGIQLVTTGRSLLR